MPFTPDGALEAAASDLPGYVEAIGQQPDVIGCEVWEIPPSDAPADEPVSSDVPTLVLAGALGQQNPIEPDAEGAPTEEEQPM